MSTNANYSENLNEAILKAKKIAMRGSHEFFSAPHLLMGLLKEETGLAPMLESRDKDVDYLKDWAAMRLETCEKCLVPPSEMKPDEVGERVLTEAERNRLVLGTDYVDPNCVFLALITPGVAYSLAQLKSLPITPQEFTHIFEVGGVSEDAEEFTETFQATGPGGGLGGKAPKMSIPYCKEYKLDKHKANEKYEVLGRDKEVRLIEETVLRYYNVGILAVGDAGVGKSALINGFISHLAERKEKFEKVWESLRILKCDVVKLISGTQGPSEVSSRVQKMFDGVKKLKGRVLLILDDFHLLLSDAESGNNSLIALIASEMDRSEVSIIATCTSDSFRKTIEKQNSLLERMEVVRISELGVMETLKCLEEYQEEFMEHYKVKVSEPALKESIHLAQRYFKERKLPFSAIDLIDRTMSAVNVCNSQSKHEVSNVSKSLEDLRAQDKAGAFIEKEDKLKSALMWTNSQMQSKISPVLLGQVANETNIHELKKTEDVFGFLDDVLGELWELTDTQIEEVSPVEVAAIVAHKTGIPIGKVQAQEKDKLINIESHLRRRVVGQDHAIKTISESIIESRSGLNQAGQPIGSFFFSGPTGTGKTELAKTIAEFLFDDEKAIIRFDMSEFKEEHSAALLYGAPPGYVGYQEGGLLVNKIRQQPYSVVLFDEIEKAHASVYDVFLQMMDEGQIHDKLGRKGDFSNAIIIFTSNIGSEWVAKQFRAKKIPTSKQMVEVMAGDFRPEFLGRLTEIVPFAPIAESVVELIFNIQLKKLEKSLDKREIKLELPPELRTKMAMMGYSEKYGARPVAAVIRSEVKRPIARKLVAEQIVDGDTVTLVHNEETGFEWVTKGSEAEKIARAEAAKALENKIAADIAKAKEVEAKLDKELEEDTEAEKPKGKSYAEVRAEQMKKLAEEAANAEGAEGAEEANTEDGE